jgi:hypothetical protein
MSEKPKPKPKPKPKTPTPNVMAKHQLRMPADLESVYANMVRIAHTPAELVIDFSALLPGDRVGKVVSRVVMSPLGAKLFARALKENIAKFESAFGEINVPQRQSLADFLFNPPPNSPNDEGTEDGKNNPDDSPPKE